MKLNRKKKKLIKRKFRKSNRLELNIQPKETRSKQERERKVTQEEGNPQVQKPILNQKNQSQKSKVLRNKSKLKKSHHKNQNQSLNLNQKHL